MKIGSGVKIKRQKVTSQLLSISGAVANPGGVRGALPPSTVKISDEKDGHQRRPHKFRVSLDPLLVGILL